MSEVDMSCSFPPRETAKVYTLSPSGEMTEDIFGVWLLYPEVEAALARIGVDIKEILKYK